MPRIKVISHRESTGRLKEIYDDLVAKRGKLADVHTIQSLRPESIVKHIDLYMEIMFSKSELSRAEREMIAVIVSRANECRYCQIHHGLALNRYWRDEQKIKKLREDYSRLDLSNREIALCKYGDELTRNPGSSHENDLTENLRANGLSDNAILDATLVVSYFNFVNRIVLALDVELENDGGGGYKY
jgi:uncharacterized peroxidase-related enzyme